ILIATLVHGGLPGGVRLHDLAGTDELLQQDAGLSLDLLPRLDLRARQIDHGLKGLRTLLDDREGASGHGVTRLPSEHLTLGWLAEDDLRVAGRVVHLAVGLENGPDGVDLDLGQWIEWMSWLISCGDPGPQQQRHDSQSGSIFRPHVAHFGGPDGAGLAG